MENDSAFVIVFITAGSVDEAKAIARGLVEDRLAACVSLVPAVTSFYVWEGRLCEEGEVLLMVKTTRQAWDHLVRRVKELHSYQVPEIIAIPLWKGSPDYLNWIQGHVQEA